MEVNPEIVLDKRILELQVFQDMSSYIFQPDRTALTEARLVSLGLAPTLLRAAEALLTTFNVAADRKLISHNDFLVYKLAVKDRNFPVVLQYLIKFYTNIKDLVDS